MMERPGWQTTEFWMTMATLAGGFMAAMGWITAEMATELQVAIGQIAGGVIALGGIIWYIWSRVKVKTK